MSGLRVVAVGEAHASDPARAARNAPSFFADPAAWLVASAVEQALDSAAQSEHDALSEATDRVGVVALSAHCTALTMAVLARGAQRGAVSPLRFAGSNPGVLAGLACIRRRLRGPSLVFAMDPGAGLEAAATTVECWLETGQAAYVALAVHLVSADGHTARCALVASASAPDSDREDPGLARRLLGQQAPS